MSQGAAGHVDDEREIGEEEDGIKGGVADAEWMWRERADQAGRDTEALVAAMELGMDMSLLDEGATRRRRRRRRPRSSSTRTLMRARRGRLGWVAQSNARGRAPRRAWLSGKGRAFIVAPLSGRSLPRGCKPTASVLRAASSADEFELSPPWRRGGREARAPLTAFCARQIRGGGGEREGQDEGEGEGGRGSGRQEVRRTAREDARARVGREGAGDRALVSESIALIGRVQASFEAAEARRGKVRQLHAVELDGGATILRWCAGAELLTAPPPPPPPSY